MSDSCPGLRGIETLNAVAGCCIAGQGARGSDKPVLVGHRGAVLQREASRPALADGGRTLAPQHGHLLPEGTRAQLVNGSIRESSDAVITPATAGSSQLQMSLVPTEALRIRRPRGRATWG